MVMNLFKRVCRHLFISPLALRKRFPKAVMQRIEQAIADSEQTHFGEIRFAVELNLPLLDILRKNRAAACGRSFFAIAGVGHRAE